MGTGAGRLFPAFARWPRPIEMLKRGDLELPVVDAVRSDVRHLPHAGGTGPKLGQAEQRPEHAGDKPLLFVGQGEVEDTVVRMAEAAVPKRVVDGDERRLLKREKYLGNALVEQQFAGSQLVQSLDLDPPLQRKEDAPGVELLVENELAHEPPRGDPDRAS